MKFLIIGASGFIGRHLWDYIKAQGYEAMGTQSNADYPDLIKFNLLTDRIENLFNLNFFHTDKPVFAVICAAISQIDRCLCEKEISHKVNVDNTITLINELTQHNIKVIFFSTDNVYDGKSGFYNENHKPNPINEYGRQKAEVESYMYNISNSLILRLSKVVGDNPNEHHLFSDWYKLIEKNQVIFCIKNQVFSPTFVEDVAYGTVLSCKRGLSGIYNMANLDFFSREELARQFALVLGEKANIISKLQSEFSFSDERPERTYLDSSKFIKATGIKFTLMREVISSFIQNL